MGTGIHSLLTSDATHAIPALPTETLFEVYGSFSRLVVYSLKRHFGCRVTWVLMQPHIGIGQLKGNRLHLQLIGMRMG